MIRPSAILLAALIAAAPLSQAAAQDRGGRGDRDRGGNRSEQVRPERRQISVAEAQGIARSRARDTDEYIGYVGTRGDQYVFRFKRNGQLFDIAVSMTGR